MNKLIRYWNQNRLMIVIMVIIIVLIIVVIRVVNGIMSNMQESVIQAEEKIPDLEKPTESVLGGGEMTEEVSTENTEIIKQFVEYCNKKSYQDAYDLLSQDCKNELFPSLDIFINDYVDEIFDTNKSFTLEMWYGTSQEFTYRILYINDNILSSGTINRDDNKEDYITIVKETGENKLNISNFIYKEEINKANSNNNIEVMVNNAKKYRSYEVYSITVTNNSDKTILLSNGENGEDICLVDNNNVEYSSMLNEIPLINLEILPNSKKTISIRFYKIYNVYRNIENITFKNIILDKDDYSSNKDNGQTLKLTVEL